MTYIARLHQAIQTKKTAALVGLDPRYENLPEAIKQSAKDHGGDRLELYAYAFERFCCEVIDVVAEMVPAVKPQAAFFEELGPAGCQALANVMMYARRAGLIVICDAKRGDIGSTAQAYASAYLAGENEHAAPWASDALTINPYLGVDTLQPFVDLAVKRDAGLYVLVRTSNPGAATFQDRAQDGTKLYEAVADAVEAFNLQTMRSGDEYGSIGAVVGATYPEELAILRKRMPHTPLLIPGFGSQGGTADDVKPAFDAHGLGAVVNNSRGINFAYEKEPYKSQFGQLDWQAAVETATKDMIGLLAQVCPL